MLNSIDRILYRATTYPSGHEFNGNICERDLGEPDLVEKALVAYELPPSAFRKQTPLRKVASVHAMADAWHFEHFMRGFEFDVLEPARLRRAFTLIDRAKNLILPAGLGLEPLVIAAKLEPLTAGTGKLPKGLLAPLRTVFERFAALEYPDTREAHALKSVLLTQLARMEMDDLTGRTGFRILQGADFVTRVNSVHLDAAYGRVLDRAMARLKDAMAEDELGFRLQRFVDLAAELLDATAAECVRGEPRGAAVAYLRFNSLLKIVEDALTTLGEDSYRLNRGTPTHAVQRLGVLKSVLEDVARPAASDLKTRVERMIGRIVATHSYPRQ